MILTMFDIRFPFFLKFLIIYFVGGGGGGGGGGGSFSFFSLLDDYVYSILFDWICNYYLLYSFTI